MSWKYVTLDKLGSVSRGKSKHRPRNDKTLFGGKYPFVQTADVKAAELYLTEYTDTYNEKGLAQSKLWPAGTLCITIAANIADTSILGIDACFPDSIIGFIPYEGVSNVKFVKYAFDILQRDCKNISQGAAQDNLSWRKLSTIKFPAPEIEIQNKIVSILSAYDDLIENNRRQIKLLEEAAQRLYKEWFVDLKFPGHESTPIINGLPEGWSKETVSFFGKVITGKTPSTLSKDNYGFDVPFVKIPDMHDCVFPVTTEIMLSSKGANLQKGKYIPSNSIMVSCIGTVGLVCLAFECCQTNQQINSLVVENNEYLYYLYFSLKLLKQLLCAIGSNGATLTNVSKKKFENIEIMCPCYALAKEFNTVCTPIFENIKNIVVMNKAAREARDRLLPKLMSGEIEV